MNVLEHDTQNYLDVLNVYERLRTTEMDSAGADADERIRTWTDACGRFRVALQFLGWSFWVRQSRARS